MMLGLAILFGLGLWLLVTIVAMVIGAKFGRKPVTKLLGAFLGFMLTMGGFIVHWTVEYYQIQRTVTHLCETEGGITVYVTPEEWRKQIGEEEWEKLIPYDKAEVLSSSSESGREIKIGGLVFEHSRGNIHLNGGILENNRVALYMTYDLSKPLYGTKSISLIIEKNTNKVLLKSTSFYYGTGAIANDLSALKFWINRIKDCNHTKEFVQIAHQYSNIKNTGVK